MPQTATKSFSFNVQAPLAITTASIPDAVEGVAYSVTLQATGGVLPYTWQLLPGSSLPSGLSLDPASGILSGTATAAGAFTANIQVTDASA